MPITGRLFARDEELGKKDDEYRPDTNGKLSTSSLSWIKNSTPRRRRRLLYGLLLLLVIYFFIKNLPDATVPYAYRVDRRVPGRTINGFDLRKIPFVASVNSANTGSSASSHTYGYGGAPTGPPPVDEEALGHSKPGQHYFNGKIKWYYLAATLQSATRKIGYGAQKNNVVFAGAGSQSIAKLIPMACEMARWNRNVVHMVIMGRDDLTIEEYKTINGVDDSCEIYFHDARPDYALYSTNARFKSSTYNSLQHVYNYLRPHVYIMDDPQAEEEPFVKGVESHAQKVDRTVLHLPRKALEDLMWITRLDTGSLGAWHNTHIEILIHAPPHSSGSLIRLLKSIRDANYFGMRYPHVTIELPAFVDDSTEHFLESFVWPPVLDEGGFHTSQLTLRRRIPTSRLTPTEASIRMIESFYPSRNKYSHVLVLSPQVELSPLYYHYLLYNILEYKHSTYGEGSWESERLVGISLTLPNRLLDDKTSFKAPSATYDDETRNIYGDYIPFLWQASDAHATLYFGDMWREFHSFLSHRLTRPTSPREKSLAGNFPAFAEHLLELMRIRNYFVLYPHVRKYAIATVHNELFQPPEEFIREAPGDESEENISIPDTNEPFLEPLPPSRPRPSMEQRLISIPLHKLLPADGDLPELATVPLLSYGGHVRKSNFLSKEARYAADIFRQDIGACPIGYQPNVYKNSADDLFCDGDKDYLAMAAEQGSYGNGVPIGYGGARGRDAVEDLNVERDEFGEIKQTPVSEEEKEAMTSEFEKHLQRQSGQQIKRLENEGDLVKSPSAESDAKPEHVVKEKVMGAASVSKSQQAGDSANHGDEDPRKLTAAEDLGADRSEKV